jgi:hypothetical protein
MYVILLKLILVLGHCVIQGELNQIFKFSNYLSLAIIIITLSCVHILLAFALCCNTEGQPKFENVINILKNYLVNQTMKK